MAVTANDKRIGISTSKKSISKLISSKGSAGKGKFTIGGTSQTSSSIPWSNIKLLLHMEGANNSTTFTDVKGTTIGKWWGDVHISTTQYKYGTSSAYFSGEEYSFLYFDSSSEFVIGTSEFTLEAWIYIDADSTPIYGHTTKDASIFNTYASGKGFFFWVLGDTNKTGTGLYFSDYQPETSDFTVTYTGDIPKQVWHHVVVCRQLNTINIYLNGIKVATSPCAANRVFGNDTSFGARIGTSNSGGNQTPFKGYMDEIRYTIGTCAYTGNFTPPTTAFPDA